VYGSTGRPNCRFGRLNDHPGAKPAAHERNSPIPKYSSFVAPRARGYRDPIETTTRIGAKTMKMIPLYLLAIATTAAGASVAAPSVNAIELTQTPLVMRLTKDEFRIAFGVHGERCASNGCSGSIHYRVDWKPMDGVTRSETKRVSYTISPHTGRTIAVDRQYFDTAEGAHTTDVVKVSVYRITCEDGSGSSAL
jgi:hypothetical protein